MRTGFVCSCVVVGLTILGCEKTKPSFTVAPDPPAPVVEPKPISQAELDRPKVEVGGRTVVEGTAEDAATATVAQAGAGKQGHTYGGTNDPAAIFGTYALASYWRANERIAFEIQIPQAMKLFRATNDRFPNSLEEYTKEILVPNQVKLPELPADKEFMYVPETGELMVRDKPQR
ncbi:MAG: hypothetical protein ACRC46_13130 [Thermoguttaceae bacterium]